MASLFHLDGRDPVSLRKWRRRLAPGLGGRVLRLGLASLLVAVGLGVSVLLTTSSASATAGDNYSSAVMADNPLLWWSLDEATGAWNAAGSLASTYPTMTAAASGTFLTARGSSPCMLNLEVGCAYATSNGAMWFGYSTYGTAPLPPFHAFTFEAVVSPKTMAKANVLVQIQTGNLSYTTGIQFYLNGANHFAIATEGLGAMVTGTLTATANTTYFVDATYDPISSKWCMYVNGSPDGTCGSGAGSWTSSLGIAVGGSVNSSGTYNASTGCVCLLQDVSIYGVALSAGRVAAHYTAAVVGGTPSTSTSTVTNSTTVTVTQTTPGETVTQTALVRGDLSADDQHRLDLAWWGVWAVVGLVLVGLVAPRWYAAWSMEGKLRG